MTFDTSILVDTLMNVNISTTMRGMDFCCTPLFEGVIDENQAADAAATLSAVADPVRLRIISMLAAAPDGVACGCDLEGPLGLSQPTVSHHLKVLREAGLVVGERRGRWVHYRLVTERLDDLRRVLDPSPLLVS
jgi:ArsR family transcriptional regulator